MSEKILITYNTFGKLADDLCSVIRSSNIKFSAVHGLPRGGLILAVHISFKLEIPLIINLTQFTKEFPNGRLLIVDDIIGTGKSYDRAIETARIRNIQYNTGVLFCRPDLEDKPNFIIDKTDSWILFPWDKEEEPINEYQRKLYMESFGPPNELVFKEPE